MELNLSLIWLAGWGFLIWSTFGLYSEWAVGLFAVWMVIPFVDWFRSESPRQGERSRGWRERVIGNLLSPQRLPALVGLFFSLLIWYRAPLIYPQQQDLLQMFSSFSLLECAMLIGILFAREPWRVILWGFIALVAIVNLALVPLISPEPYIDVWSYTRMAIDAWRIGLDPYSLSYPQMYPGVEGHFPYFPLVIYLLAPFQILFQDHRFGLLVANVFSAAFLGLIAARWKSREEALGVASLYLLFPALPFVLEQSWTDSLSLPFLFLALWLQGRRNGGEERAQGWGLDVGAAIALGLFAAIKQYNAFFAIPLLILLLLRGSSGRNRSVRGAVLAAFFAALILPFLPVVLNGADTFLSAVSHVPVMQQPIFLSLANWFVRRGFELSNLFAVSSAGLGVMAFLIIQWRRRAWASETASGGEIAKDIFWLGWLFFWLLLWYRNTAANYLWFALAGLWVTVAVASTSDGISRLRFAPEWGWFVVSRLIVIFALPPILTDVGLYWDYAGKMVAGARPFIHFEFEYPPGALAFVFLPKVAAQALGMAGANLYRFCLHLLLLIFDVLFFRRLQKARFSHSLLLGYVAFTSLLFPLLYDRIDLAIGILMAWPVLAEFSFLSGAALGFGAFSKFVPALLTPLYILRSIEDLKGGRRWERAFIALLLAVGPLAMAIFTVALIAPNGEVAFLKYHSARGIQIESIYGGAMLLAQSSGLDVGVGIANSFKSFNLVGVSDTAVQGVFVLFVGAMAVCSGWIFRQWLGGRREWATWSWMLTLTFVIFNRVLSPQFLLWLICLAIPYMAELESRRRRSFFAIFSVILLLTLYLVINYFDLVKVSYFSLIILNLRNFLMALLLPLSWYWSRGLRETGKLNGKAN